MNRRMVGQKGFPSVSPCLTFLKALLENFSISESAFASVAILILAISACAPGPDYVRPEVPVPTAYREGAPWKEARPADELPKGPWWRIFGDSRLTGLLSKISTENLDLAAAASRIEQARAAAGIAGAGTRPSITFDPSAQRARLADDFSTGGKGETTTTLRAPVDMSYELDFFGRVKNSVKAAESNLAASKADYQNLLLSLQADAARDYFSLRALDAQIQFLDRTYNLRQRSLELINTQYKYGRVSRLDLARAKAELASARADRAALTQQRSAREHALAVLLGENPSSFSLKPDPLDLDEHVPALSPGLPSSLLERRPDIAAAERRLMAANARIKAANAVFFPSIRLTGNAGYASQELGSLFNWGNRTWALGPFLSLPLFDGGKNKAGLELARAQWDEAVALYRKQVLLAFSEVEDSLSDLESLSIQFDALRQTFASARKASDLTDKLYRAGDVSYLEVVISERTVLAAQVQAVRVLGQRLQASATLIKALGGGWKDETAAGPRGPDSQPAGSDNPPKFPRTE